MSRNWHEMAGYLQRGWLGADPGLTERLMGYLFHWQVRTAVSGISIVLRKGTSWMLLPFIRKYVCRP